MWHLSLATQDADEFYGQLMYSLLSKLKDVTVPLHNGGAGGSAAASARCGGSVGAGHHRHQSKQCNMWF